MTRCQCVHRDLCLHAYIDHCGCINISHRAGFRALLARFLNR